MNVRSTPNYVKRDIVITLVDPVLDYTNVLVYGWRCAVHGTVGKNRILAADNDKAKMNIPPRS